MKASSNRSRFVLLGEIRFGILLTAHGRRRQRLEAGSTRAPRAHRVLRRLTRWKFGQRAAADPRFAVRARPQRSTRARAQTAYAPADNSRCAKYTDAPKKKHSPK
jgi:hypothetical protein